MAGPYPVLGWLVSPMRRMSYSALAAAGTGIAGGYTTLLAAVSLYDMVSKPVALVVAAAIASVGVTVSLAWGEEVVAGFGLVGAMIVPATLVFQGGLQEIGTAFVAALLQATAALDDQGEVSCHRCMTFSAAPSLRN